MITFEGALKWLRGVREPVGYDWDARLIPTLPKVMLQKTLEWKRDAVFGDVDVTYALQIERRGWRPVHSIFGRPIERDGLRLMWRDAAVQPTRRPDEESLFQRQLIWAQRGTSRVESLREPDYFVDHDILTEELATRGKRADWGFDPYEGTNVDEALDAIDALIKEDLAKERVVPIRPSSDESLNDFTISGRKPSA